MKIIFGIKFVKPYVVSYFDFEVALNNWINKILRL